MAANVSLEEKSATNVMIVLMDQMKNFVEIVVDLNLNARETVNASLLEDFVIMSETVQTDQMKGYVRNDSLTV